MNHGRRVSLPRDSRRRLTPVIYRSTRACLLKKQNFTFLESWIPAMSLNPALDEHSVFRLASDLGRDLQRIGPIVVGADRELSQLLDQKLMPA